MTARSNNSSLIYVKEIVLGVTPTDSPNWNTFPLAGADGLNMTNVTTASTRVRGDRGSNGTIKTGETVSGSVPSEFQADQFDDLIESAVMGEFSAGTLVNAAIKSSYAFERNLGDLTNKYIVYNGVRVDTMSLDAPTREKINIEFGLMGLTSDDDNAASLVGAGSVAPVSSNRVMSFGDLGAVTIDGVSGYCIESLSLNTTNNLEEKVCASSPNGAAVDQLEGTFELTGNIVVATTDSSWALLATKRTNTPVPIVIPITDGTVTYTITIHEAFINFPDPSGQGQNSSIPLNIDFTARQSDAASATVTIVKS